MGPRCYSCWALTLPEASCGTDESLVTHTVQVTPLLRSKMAQVTLSLPRPRRYLVQSLHPHFKDRKSVLSTAEKLGQGAPGRQEQSWDACQGLLTPGAAPPLPLSCTSRPSQFFCNEQSAASFEAKLGGQVRCMRSIRRGLPLRGGSVSSLTVGRLGQASLRPTAPGTRSFLSPGVQGRGCP